ncbi:hypothetical protein HYH03_008900 [Edaphochlamys debaryana]|uniref:Uncharacterized protein n=1 Tax=Edaphochlamys debaryana TaxID=47281 RepID=A0A835XZT3_9CHLO|nr:hypothetical protein HYH03_008900 [Edaphochlamys debaryana]|eukprot:KAG2492734.1 hypothetical protein HYH03_008900 [Edaphochlamys debaryana]
MGAGRSKHVYAFQPLPWPEALAAFRLIDQVCGIATTYATTQLDGHAVHVLNKVGELQRLPFMWDVFEGDFERLRGTHMVRLAAELHDALDKLEGCKFDMGLLAEKGTTFRSQRKQADKALALLIEVEEIHRAFHYAFELALYASIREEPGFATSTRRSSTPGRSPPATLASRGGASRGGFGSSGGGAGPGFASQTTRRALPPPPPEPEDSGVDGSPPQPRISQGSMPRAGTMPARAATMSSRGGAVAAASAGGASAPGVTFRTAPAAMGGVASAGGAAPPPPHVAASPPLPPPPPPPPPMNATQSLPRRTLSRGGGTSSRRSAGGGGGGSTARSQFDPGQPYVVMYMPQGPDGSGPRALLVPSTSLQAAPPSPMPSLGGAASMYGTGTLPSPYGTTYSHPRTALPTPPRIPMATAMASRPPTYLSGSTSRPGSPSLLTRPASPASSLYGTIGSTLTSRAPYSTTSVSPYGITTAAMRPSSPPSYRYFSPPGSPSAAVPYTPYSPGLTPDLSSYYLQRSALSESAGSPYSSLSLGASPPPLTATSPIPAVVPGAAPGSVLVFQPVSAHPGPGGGLVLQNNPSQQPVLVVAQEDPAVANASANASANATAAANAAAANANAAAAAAQNAAVAAASAATSAANAATTAALGSQQQARPTTGTRGVRFQAGPPPGGHATQAYYGQEDEVGPYIEPYGNGGYDERYEEDNQGPEEYDEQYGEDDAGQYGDQAVAYGGRSGGGAQSLMSQFCDMTTEAEMDAYGEPAGPPPAPVQQQPTQRRHRISTSLRRRQRMAAATATSATTSPTQLPPREAEMEYRPPPPPPPATRGGGGAATTQTPLGPIGGGPIGTGHVLSYERLATLAGLDPALLSDGAATGLAMRPGGVTGGGGGGAHRRAVPGEPALRRAEELAEAAEAGDVAAAVELAAAMRRGWWGDARDAAVARGLLMQAAVNGGSADAHAALGEMAEHGEGLAGGRPDLPAAARHYAAAAAAGHRDGTTAYAYLLEHGLGVEQDEVRAAQLYATAAQRNCPTAANNLAKMILDGRGGIVASPPNGQRPIANRRNRKPGADSGGAWSTAAAAAAAAAVAAASGAGSAAAVTPVALATALFKRAAQAGSTAAWYNLGVCHLQQLKVQNQPGVVSVVPHHYREEHEREAIVAFTEAAKRGHARAALRAGHLQLQRSSAAAAVEAFASAALNSAAAAAGGAAEAGVGADTTAIGAATSGRGGNAGGGASAEVEAEALWCLAQLAERQAAVLEGRAAAVSGPAGWRDGAGDGGRGGSESRGSSQHDSEGGDDEGRMVRQLLATLASPEGGGGPGVTAAAEGLYDTVTAGDPAAAAAVAFARELCRLDFDICRQSPAQLYGASAAVAAASPSGAPPVRGLKRLRRQARELLTDPAAVAGAAAAAALTGGAVDTSASASRAESLDGDRNPRGGREGPGAGDGTAEAALARLDLHLLQPGERAQRARRAAADLMAAAAARGHASAQHWLAGWQWSMGSRGAAVALWEAAGRRGHGGALMVLGQMAEAGQLPPALGSGLTAGGSPTGGAGGADLAAAARYYLRAQEAGASGAVEAMRRVQRVLQRHVALQGKLAAVVGGATPGAAGRVDRIPAVRP